MSGLFAVELSAITVPEDHRARLLLIKSATSKFAAIREVSDELQDLVTKMLTVDPAQRITIPEIRRHPWIGGAMEEEALTEMAALNFDDLPSLSDDVASDFDDPDFDPFIDEEGFQ